MAKNNLPNEAGNKKQRVYKTYQQKQEEIDIELPPG